MNGFRTPQVERLTGVSGAVLHYWSRTGFLVPSLQEARGRGTRRLYSFADVVAVRVAKELRDAGIPLQSLRVVVRRLQGETMAHPLGEKFLVTDGHEVYLPSGNELVGVLREHGQKYFFWRVIDLQLAVREVSDNILKLASEETGGEGLLEMAT